MSRALPEILDPCCGSRMMYFDKGNPLVLFCDNRELHTRLCDGRRLDVEPEVRCDFRELPFPDGTFRHVAFDPPHNTGACRTTAGRNTSGAASRNAGGCSPTKGRWCSSGARRTSP